LDLEAKKSPADVIQRGDFQVLVLLPFSYYLFLTTGQTSQSLRNGGRVDRISTNLYHSHFSNFSRRSNLFLWLLKVKVARLYLARRFG
jgi:hypothetical protein